MPLEWKKHLCEHEKEQKCCQRNKTIGTTEETLGKEAHAESFYMSEKFTLC